MVSPSTLSKRADVDRATYTLSEFAALLGVSYTYAHEAVTPGGAGLPVTPIRLGRKYLFPKTAVHKLLGIEEARSETA